MENKGNKIENWDAQYKGDTVTYTEKIETPAQLSNLIQFEFVHQDIMKYLGNKGDLKILEVGCGGARTSLFLALRGLNVTCSDFSPGALRLAKDNFDSAKAQGIFVQDDLLNSTLCPESYDCIMSFGLLEHFEDPNPVIASMTKLLKPGGLHIHCIITKKFSTQTFMNAVLYPYNFLKRALIKRDYKDIISKSFRDFPHYENRFKVGEYARYFKDAGNTVLRREAGATLYPFLCLPFGVDNFLARNFTAGLKSMISIMDRSESKILHMIAPTMYFVCRKNA